MNILDSDADGPLAWFVGFTMLILALGAFICGIIIVVPHPPSDMEVCVTHGGTWSHTLSQQEARGTNAHWDDTCKGAHK